MRTFLLPVLSLILFSFCHVSVAQSNDEAEVEIATVNAVKSESAEFDAGRNIKLIYASSSWNQDSTKIDTAFLFLRDRSSGKTAKIILDETEPDSSTFSGNFSLGFASSKDFFPEIYIPPQSLREGQSGLDKFYSLLKKKELQRKPIVLRKDKAGKQLLDVYDTNDQAERAKKVYEEELKKTEKAEAKKVDLAQSVPEEATLEAAEMSERAKAFEKLAKEARERELERIRLEQIQRQKALEKERQAKAMSEAEQAKRKAQAQKLIGDAEALFRAGRFQEAEDKFEKAIEVNPFDKSYYYSYAITLYRNEKYNEAMVAMKMAPETAETAQERMYYVALIHYRLNEFTEAIANFQNLKQMKHPILSSSSAFYEGLIYFSQEDLEASQAAFEYVLDNSQDPALDKQAEEYIERILTVKKYKELAKQKIFLNGTFGAMYDSNVTLAPDNVSSQGTSLQKGSPRALFSGGGQYRFLYTPENELRAGLNAVYLYSTDSSVATADAAVFNFNLPWTNKGLIQKKGYSLNVKPSYEVILLDPTASGQTPFMPVAFQSAIVNTDITLINNQKWFSTYGLEVRSDDSRLVDASADENSDALKYTLKTNQTLLLDDSKKKVLVGSLGLVMNDAKGKNKQYFRYQGSATYVAPTNWDAAWNLGLAVYQLEYPDNSNNRKDFNVSLTSGFQKPLKEWFIWGVTANYMKNASNVEANDYSKYMVLTTATFNYSM